jgi:hypothetical protein
MKRILVIVVLAAIALVPNTAAAAPAAPPTQCVASATTQFDMAGTYSSTEHQMYVEIFPCGGIYVEWKNRFGSHAGAYRTEVHPSDGVLATHGTGEALDSQPHIAVKAAERGYVQLWTLDDDLKIVKVYRLRKTS